MRERIINGWPPIHTRARNRALNPQTWYVFWLGISPATCELGDVTPTNWATQPGHVLFSFLFKGTYFFVVLFLFIYWLIWEGERGLDIDQLFHLRLHSLLDCWMCPHCGLNPQPSYWGNTVVYWITPPGLLCLLECTKNCSKTSRIFRRWNDFIGPFFLLRWRLQTHMSSMAFDELWLMDVPL